MSLVFALIYSLPAPLIACLCTILVTFLCVDGFVKASRPVALPFCRRKHHHPPVVSQLHYGNVIVIFKSDLSPRAESIMVVFAICL